MIKLRELLAESLELMKGHWLQAIAVFFVFNLIILGPLGCVFEFTKEDVTKKIHDIIPNIEFGDISEYVTFELLRNIKSECDVFDTRVSQLGIFLPPVWLIQNRLWEPLLATLAIYAITLSVHWALFIISSVLLALYPFFISILQLVATTLKFLQHYRQFVDQILFLYHTIN